MQEAVVVSQKKQREPMEMTKLNVFGHHATYLGYNKSSGFNTAAVLPCKYISAYILQYALIRISVSLD